MPVTRNPEGTEDFPVPHTRIDWARSGDVSISVEVRPGGWFRAPAAPKVEGYEVFFVAHHGQERTVYTYRPVKQASA